MSSTNIKRLFLTLSIFLLIILGCNSNKKQITYGISPYQDTILPIVAEKQGWYKTEGLDVKIKILEWGDVMNSLAGGAVDIAIQNFNSFQAVYNNINEKGGDVIFYFPYFIFKGTAIMARDTTKFKTINYFLNLYPNNREKAIVETVKQLKGRVVITTKGTEMEQIVLSAMNKAGLKESDVKIIHALPADGLNAFLHGDGDFYSGGVTERTEARKHGAIELIETSDLNPPVVDGLVTTEKFAKEHKKELNKIIKLWFKTIQWMEEDLDKRSKLVIEYLSSVSSTKYTLDEYKYTWFHTEVFPRNIDEVNNLTLQPNSYYYWKNSWDSNNQFLISEKKISKPVPYTAFWGEKIYNIINEN